MRDSPQPEAAAKRHKARMYPPVREILPRMLLALAIGTGGGALFWWASLPLPWMLGAMLATAVGAFTGVRLQVDPRLRTGMMLVLGTLLGAAFSPEIIYRVGAWPISLTALLGYVVMASLLSFFFYRKYAGIDARTAFFSSVPGGLAVMITLGIEAGADERKIGMIHSTRIFLVVMLLPLAFRLIEHMPTGMRSMSGDAAHGITAIDIGMLVASAVVGYFGARLLRLPAPQLIGPMIASASIHMTGLTAAAPPVIVVAAAQVIIGSSIGSRFSGLRFIEVARYMLLGAISTVLLLALTLVYALALTQVMDGPIEAFILAFAPGGLTEMSLVALALNIDTAFVATHHIVRIAIIVVLTPYFFTLMRKSGLIATGRPSAVDAD